MSDFVLSVIPTDPRWQPDREAGDRMAAMLRRLAPEADIFDVDWHERITVVDCGDNLERITCPLCRGPIDPYWYGDLLEEHDAGRFDDLRVVVPCCGGQTSLDALDYDWAVGFARFEVAVWNALWEPLDAATLESLGRTLGHPVRQILAHI
ncbi:MAG TPA: hypothetical protein VF062_27900 [Candidatus Limnocylindrales bacterium]